MTDLDPKALDAAIAAAGRFVDGVSHGPRPSEWWICLDDGQIVERFVNRQDRDAALQRRNAGATILAYLATRREQGRVEVRVDDDVVAPSIVAAAVEEERARCEQAAPALIFNVVQQARYEEREACALIVESQIGEVAALADNRIQKSIAEQIGLVLRASARFIRARSSISTKGENT